MTDKKPYSAPQIFQVELNHEQAILSQCSTTAINQDDAGNGRGCFGNCRKCMSPVDHGNRPS